MTGLLAASVLLPALAGAASAALAGSRRRAPAAIAWATGLSLVCAIALAFLLAAGPTATAILWHADDGAALIGLRANPVAVLLLLLILGVSATVQAFALRSLRGDERRQRFAVLAGLLTTAAAATATAATLIGLAVAWSATSVLLCLLVGLYRGAPTADEGIRRTARAVLIGDAALWLAVAILTARYGSIDLRQLAAQPPAADAFTTPVALLILAAAAARSAQVPFHGWLPATLASPTPVSAMLHAGVVNAGAVLLLALAPIVTAAPIAMHAAILLGTVTAIVGTTLMLARPDVKGALAQSTVGQMGFMVLTCGFGAWAAAIIHLSAHGAYKATRFLGSGSAVAAVASANAAPAAPTSHTTDARNALVAGLAAAIALAATAWAIDLRGTAALLLVFAWGALTAAGRGWLARHGGASGTFAWLVATVALAAAYTVAIHALSAVLAPGIPTSTGALPSPWLLIPVAVSLAIVPALSRFGPPALRHRLYVWALTVGDGSRPPRRRRGTPRPQLVIDPEGSHS